MFSLASNLPSPEVGYHATLSINFSTFSKKKKKLSTNFHCKCLQVHFTAAATTPLIYFYAKALLVFIAFFPHIQLSCGMHLNASLICEHCSAVNLRLFIHFYHLFSGSSSRLFLCSNSFLASA